MSLSFGGGIWFKLGDRVGVQLDGRAVQYHGYDREFFNPARGRREQLTPFVEDFPKPPAEKTTPMSTTFTLGFRYVPAAGVTNDVIHATPALRRSRRIPSRRGRL
jgi:hypothetical protein